MEHKSIGLLLTGAGVGLLVSLAVPASILIGLVVLGVGLLLLVV